MHRTLTSPFHAVFKLLLATVLLALGSSTLFAATKPKTTTYSDIDDITTTDTGTGIGWGICSACAGGQVTDTYWMAQHQTSPSLFGSSTELFMSSTTGYSNVLYYNKLGANDTASHFTWDFWVQVDSSSSAAQTFEFDTFQFLNGRRYMFGTQCNYQSGQWQIWNEGGGKWLNAGFACQKFTPNKWYHITWVFHRGTGTDMKMYYDSLTIQQYGSRTATTRNLRVSEPSGPLPTGWGDNLGVQFQLDLGKNPGELHEWIDLVSLTVY